MSVLTYEWRRLWSVRSTWINSGIYLLIVGLIGAGPIFLTQETIVQSWNGLYSTPSFVLALVALSVVAAQAFGHEYRYGLIRITLSEFPARERVLIAKTIMTIIYVGIMLIVAWAMLGIIGLLAGERVSSNVEGFSLVGTHIPSLTEVLLWSIAYCILAFSVSLLARNLALGIVLPLLMTTLIEPILGVINQLSENRINWIVNNLPMTNGQAWLNHDATFNNAGLIFTAWVLGSYLLAATRFAFKDA